VLFIASLALNLECPAANSHRLGNRCLFVRIVSTISRFESGVSLLIARLLASDRLAASVNRAEFFMIPVQVAKLDDQVKNGETGKDFDFRILGLRLYMTRNRSADGRRTSTWYFYDHNIGAVTLVRDAVRRPERLLPV
jgi:hypothetical protein